MASIPPVSGSFNVKATFQGRSEIIPDVNDATTASELRDRIASALGLSDASLKLLHKGKVLGKDGPDSPAFPGGFKGKLAKVLVMATDLATAEGLYAMKSDPLIRGFDDEDEKERRRRRTAESGAADGRRWWGPAHSSQHRHYRFVKIEPCDRHSFGHRAGSRTPHEFRARELLERLATDPGVVAVMTERELVVNALGEMDPIDDRLMQKKKTEEGMCLLGYNTNHGLRIDLKLRTDDLSGFLPYEDIAATLVHELSHNWVGEHDALFWSNYGQMRAEYLHRHASLAAAGYLANGQTTAAVAGVAEHCKGGMKSVAEFVLGEISQEASRHGVPMALVAPAVLKRCDELKVESEGSEMGQKLGGNNSAGGTEGNAVRTARELALAAAERRARTEKEQQDRDSRRQ